MKQKKLQYKIAVWLTMGLMVIDPLAMPFAYADNPIEVDRNAPHERQAQMGQAANGITLINITGPSAGGVSRNDYTKFNVSESGVILNNGYNMSNTQLAGYVPGNANMMRGSANVIVNEVTSTNPTTMNGFIEVAGRKASVVVANPNGITVDGGGFINTDRAVLTTGKPEYDARGNLNSYRVEQGQVAINGNGLNAKGANALHILTEAANINAGVWANETQLRTGKNEVDAKTLETNKLGESNRVGLDVAAIGGMYANSITMKGSNAGLGVNVQGTLSSVQATSISADGTIHVDGGITSNGRTEVTGQSVDVTTKGIVQGDSFTSIESQSKLENQGLINSNGKTSIKATLVDNKENGRIYGNTVAISADTVKNHTNAEIEDRYNAVANELKVAKEKLEAEWNADITAYKTRGEMKSHRDRIDTLTKEYDAVQAKMTAMQNELDSHKSGTIAGREHTDIDAKDIHNTGNGLIYSGNTMKLTGTEVIENKGATIKSGGKMSLNTAKLDNKNAAFGMKRVSDGIIQHADKVRVEDRNNPESGQIFDVSEFPGIYKEGGYGVDHKVPVLDANGKPVINNDGTVKLKNKEGMVPVHEFTYIRSEEEHTHTKITHDNPGLISAGGDVEINGQSINDNSQIISGGVVKFNGPHETISDETSDRVINTGSIQHTWTRKTRKSHGIRSKRVRSWGAEVFTTPSIEENNIKPIGTVQEHAEDALSEANKRKVNDSLDPFGTGGQGKSSIGTSTIDGLKLPTESIYNIHPDITANALVETDSAFTNRKKFVSSDYMLKALANDPERRMKRLGDGFYEQSLINTQIVNATGKQYLEGYSDNETEYKALLDAGIAYGKQYQLTPGIALTEEQMKAITTDMVWLETRTVMVNGQPQDVLYPKVYLAKQSAKAIDAMGGVVSGRQIVANTNGAFSNNGVMTADAIVIRANTVENTGRLNGNTVTIGADDTIRNTGNIHGNDGVLLRANKDITIEAETKKLMNQDVMGRQGTIGVSNEKASVDIHSNNNVNLNGAILHGGVGTTMSITAGNDVNLGTKKLSSKKDMTASSTNYVRADRSTEAGTYILGDGDVTVAANNDVHIRQGVVNSEQGKTTIAAGHDVDIEHGNTYSRDQYGLQYKEKGLLSRTINTIRKDSEHTGVTASTIGGKAIDVKSNHDVNITGTNVLGTDDVTIAAGNKVRTDSAEDTSRNETYEHSKKSGIMSAGIGFTIGSKKVTDTYDGTYKTQVASNISSTNGKINVSAGNEIHSTTTNYFAKEPANLSAPNVTIDGKHNETHVLQTHEEKRSGLTVSAGGMVVSSLNAAQQSVRNAQKRQGSALAALEYAEGADAIKNATTGAIAYANIHPKALTQKEKEVLQQAEQRNMAYSLQQRQLSEDPEVQRLKGKEAKYNDDVAKKDKLFNVNVSIGSSKFKQTNEIDQKQYVGSSVWSNTKVNITAKGDSPNTGNIHITGSTVDAPVVELNASHKLRFDAGTNTTTQRNDYTNSGWSIGATVSPHGRGVIGLEASAYKGKENAIETSVTNTGTLIHGTNSVNTQSGENTEIVGSKIVGKGVTTKVGKDLQIESLQDTNDYKKRSVNKGISVSYGMSGNARVGFDNDKGKTDSHYASVTDQAGIFSGEDGYHVDVADRTQLTGGIIKGSQDKTKNRLKSKSLEMKDIKNEASYSAKTSGYSLTNVKTSKVNPLGITGSPKMGIPVKKSASSTTHSAISEGIIEIADRESLEKINHDTEQALNKFAPIFDKKKVEEKQLFLSKISDHGFKLIGDIAAHKQTELMSQALNAKIQGDDKKAKALYDESKKWGEHGEYKILMHAGFGAFISKSSGYGSGKGLTAAGVNEVMQGTINVSKNSEVRKLVSFVIGNSVGGEIGGSIAEKATEFNWLEHEDRQHLNTDFAELFANVGELPPEEKLHQLREKGAYYYALMRYQRDYHDYYNSDNKVHSTDGGIHLDKPYYTNESYEQFVNNLFAYVVGETPEVQKFYFGRSEDYYNEMVNSNKYMQDKGWTVTGQGYQASDGREYLTMLNGAIHYTGIYRGKTLELAGYQTVLGDDGKTYFTYDENGKPWYNPNPENSSRQNADMQYYEAHRKQIDAMYKHSLDGVNIELSRIDGGKEHSVNFLGAVYKVRKGDKPNTVYRTVGANVSVNPTTVLKAAKLMKNSYPDAYLANNDEIEGFTLLGFGFEKNKHDGSNKDIDLKNSRFKIGHTILKPENDYNDFSLRKVEDFNVSAYGPDAPYDNTNYDINKYKQGVPIGAEVEYTKTYEAHSGLTDEEEALVPNIDIDNMRAISTYFKNNGQGKKYRNRNNGKLYYVKTEPNGSKKIFTNSGTYEYIKDSILATDYYEDNSNGE